MATLKQKIEAEQRGREMLDVGGLRQPDHVEYGYTCIRFFWTEGKAALIIEIDEPPEDMRSEPADVAASIEDGEDR